MHIPCQCNMYTWPTHRYDILYRHVFRYNIYIPQDGMYISTWMLVHHTSTTGIIHRHDNLTSTICILSMIDIPFLHACRYVTHSQQAQCTYMTSFPAPFSHISTWLLREAWQTQTWVPSKESRATPCTLAKRADAGVHLLGPDNIARRWP